MTVAEILPGTELHTTHNDFGLGGLRAHDGRAFPLTKVKVRASVAGPCSRTVVEQHFANPFDETLDVTFIFPLPDTGALVEFELRSGEIVVRGECQERAQARETFETARREGKRTALVEKEQGDVHTLSLAGLPARSDVTIRLTLVELLPAIDGRFRWHFPTTIAPRYTPGSEIGHDGFGINPDTDAVPNASRLSPPVRLEGGTQLDLEVEIAGPLTALESSLHAVRMSLDNGSVRIAPSTRATMNKDFILEFSTAASTTSATRAWTDGTHTLVLLEPPAESSVKGVPRDAVFAVDISGSMEGVKMEAAKIALRGALHGLRNGDRFKLIAFDDRVEIFSQDFSSYTDRNVAAADKWIAKLNARGSTEMLIAIQASLEGDTPAGRLRTVLLITDGQSNDETRLLPAIANRKGNALFFTLGIDTAVNAALLKSLALAGGGVCELCTPSDNIDAVVARLESRFGSPLISEIKVAGAARPDGQVVFAGRPASLLLDNAPSTVEVSGVGVDGAFHASVAPTPLSFPLGSLWAMQRVAWLEERLSLRPFEDEAIRPEIIRIALQWKISSKFTSFVCVDHSTLNNSESRHVVQPSEVPEAWELNEMMSSFDALTQGGAPPFMRSPMPRFSLMPAMPMPHPSQPSASGPRDVPLSAPPMSSMHMPGSAPPSAPRIGDVLSDIFSIGKKRKQKSSTGEFAVSAPPVAKPAKGTKPEDNAGLLARTQSADGSFDGDVGRTAAALLVLVMSGNTRRKGDRRRTVQKAAEWLATHASDSRVKLALDALDEAERNGCKPLAAWHLLDREGGEGQILAGLLSDRGL